MVDPSCFRPCETAWGMLRFDPGESGVNRNSGRAKTANQIADTTPTARSGSCLALSRPNSGCGFHDQASRKNTNTTIPMALPRLKPSPERKPRRPFGATFGSMALQNTLQYSNETPAMISGIITAMSCEVMGPEVMCGTAHHVASMQGAP